MTRWRPLSRIAFAVCIHPFHPSSPHDLPLEIGDELYIIEQGGPDLQWFRGYLVAPPSLLAGLTSVKGQTLEARVFSGIFPRVCVDVREVLGDGQPPQEPRADGAPRPPAPVPMLKIGDETPTSTNEPLVDEIASCLREWHSTKVHELMLARRYSALDHMAAIVTRLDTARRQLLHRVLTARELDRMREATVWDLVAANKMLCGHVIARSPSQRGRILTADDSAIDTTRLQSMMSLLDSRPTPPADDHNLHHLFVSLRKVHGDVVPGAAQLTMYLCRSTPGEAPQPLSEAFAFDLTTREGVPVPLTGDRLRSLFVGLSSTDIGEGAGAGSTLHLVFRLITNEPMRTTTAEKPVPVKETAASHSPGVQPSAYGSIKGGRRNAMFKRKDSSGSSPRAGETPETPPQMSPADLKRLQAPESRPDTAATGSKGGSRDQKLLKRAVAVGVLRVNHFMQSEAEIDQTVTMWSTAGSDEEAVSEDAYDKVLSEVFPSISGKYKENAPVDKLVLHLRAFVHPDAQGLIEKTPTLLHNIKQTQKIGFSGAPTKPRSDIYLTLVAPSLPKNAFLAHPKLGTVPLVQLSSMGSLQLTIEVRKSSGQRIENCIFPSANSAGHTAWRTTAVAGGEAWNSTLRLAIDPQEVPGSHLVMSIADAPGFPFALCWMPLWNNDAFVRDGDHALSLYKYDEYTSGMIAGKGAYLGLPWSAKNKDEHVMGPMAAVQLKTFLCSTRFSQDPTILGLIKWQENPSGELVGLLRRFNFVPEIEIVKLMSEVFDALFAIQNHYAGSDEYEDLVFNAIVIVLGIVHDRRFNLEPLVDQYARTKVFHSLATSCLMQSFSRLLSKPLESEASRRLRATFKVGKLIMKFLVNAREKQRAKEESIGIKDRAQFIKELKSLFTSLEALMRNSSPILIGTKTLLVQNFHSWLPELDSCMSSGDLFKLADSFMEACESVQGKLILYKILLVHHLSALQTFRTTDTRRVLLTKTVQWLAPYWGRVDNVTEQWKDQVRLCCSVVASQVEELGQQTNEYMPKLVDSYRAIQATERPAKKTLSLLFPTTYPFPSRPTTTEASFDEAMIEISAVLAAMSSLPTLIHLDWKKEETSEHLFSVLQVYISILNCEAFPSSWLSVHIYQHKATLRALEKLYSILTDSFLPLPDEADQFNTELWRAFFDALLKLVGSDALALETFPEQKRRAVWKIAGDVREQGAELLQRSWEAIGWENSAEDRDQYGIEKMGGFQVQYVPGLVAPIVELCLSVHEGLRGVATEILQTMIVSEWTLSEDLSLIQAEMIDCLDHLFKTKRPTETVLQKHFIRELLDLFEPLAQDPEEPLLIALKSLIATIDDLLDLLVAVHSTETTGEIFHIMDTLHLMEFLKDMHKEDMYIRYVHQLVDLQTDVGNYAEAGLALRLHADLYDWDPNQTLGSLTEPSFPSQNSFERKEQLYFQMIEYYETGQSWHHALGAYTELASQYEHHTFDFTKLARTQHAMAKIHEGIAKGERSNPRYFRVVYKGLGFPVGLRDKQYICEGTSNDRLASFTDRMQQLHPSAQILGSGAEQEVEGQYLQIYPVSPQKDLSHPIYQRPKVAQSVRDYYLLSRPSHFTSTSRRSPSRASAKDYTVEKTVYTTAEAFPTILRRSEIVSTGTVLLTPLETAIERTTRKTMELAAMEKKIVDGDDAALNNMSHELMHSVNTNDETCVANYHDLLPRRRNSTATEEEEAEKDRTNPLENALHVALVDYAMVIRRCLALYTRPAQQATKTDITQRFEMAYDREIAVLQPAAAPTAPSLTSSWRAPRTSQNATPTQDDQQLSPTQVASPPPDDRTARQDKKRLSLAFLTKGVINGTGNSDSDSKPRASSSSDAPQIPAPVPEDDAHSIATTSRSRSKETSRSRLSLSFLRPGSPVEALPSFSSADWASPSAHVNGQKGRAGSRSESEHSRKGSSVKKRLSFMSISKKSSRSSVLGRPRGMTSDAVLEE